MADPELLKKGACGYYGPDKVKVIADALKS